MSRTPRTARKAGTAFASDIAGYIARCLGDDRIERRAPSGSKDRGDVTGLHLSPALRAGRVVIECKNVAVLALAQWVAEADVERGNDDAVVGVVVHKRVRHGHPGHQYVTMTVDDLVALLTGERPAA